MPTASNHPRTAAQLSDGSASSWATLSHATGAPDGQTTSVFCGTSQISNTLLLTNFGFSIPTGASITNFLFSIVRKDDNAVLGDVSMMLFLNGTVIPGSPGDGTTDWSQYSPGWASGALTEADYPSGVFNPTVTQLNDPTFGIALQCGCSAGEDTAYIDGATVTVSWDPPTGPPAGSLALLGVGS